MLKVLNETIYYDLIILLMILYFRGYNKRSPKEPNKITGAHRGRCHYLHTSQQQKDYNVFFKRLRQTTEGWRSCTLRYMPSEFLFIYFFLVITTNNKVKIW